MPTFPLVRFTHAVDVFDDEAPRAWLCERVREEVRLRGEPHPRVVAMGDGIGYTLDLNGVASRDPRASVALTVAALARRAEVHRVFVVMRLEGEGAAGERHLAAFVVEPEADADTLWVASLVYVVDPASGVGDPVGDWSAVTRPSGALPPFLEPILCVTEGARPADLEPPRPPEPDIRAAFGVVPAELPLPGDAVQQCELTTAMALGEVLREGLSGVIVLRFAGRAWEWWVLGEGLPTDLDEMIRVICARPPVPDGVALVQLARFDGPVSGVGVQVIAERAGARAERWVLLEFPDGPRGERKVGRILARTLSPPGEDGWIGVPPIVDFDLTALGGPDP
jgi:hypothetical protein